MRRELTTPDERQRVLIYAVLVMAALLLPYFAGLLTATRQPGWIFGGFLIGVEDGYSYLAKMRLGANGDWLFHMVYTTEPHDPIFAFLPYLLLGKVATLFVSPAADSFAAVAAFVYHAARFICGVLCILATHRFIALFIRRGAARWLAFVLATLGGGLGWLLILIGQSNLFGSLPVEFYLPEGYSFLLLFTLPHLALARAALLTGLVLLLRSGNIAAWLLAGVCFLVMGVCVPFYIAVLYALFGVWGLLAWARRRAFPLDLFKKTVIAALVPLPLLLYNTVAFTANPVMAAWQVQNQLPSPNPLHYVFGFGMLYLFALPALRWAWRRGGSRVGLPLLLAWVLAAPLLAYLPVTVQRRLLEGLYVPLCILAVLGLRLGWSAALRYRKRTRRIVFERGRVLLYVLLLPSSVLLFIGGFSAATKVQTPVFQDAARISDLQRLSAAYPRGTVLLATYEVGNIVPAFTDLRAFVGHGPETIQRDEKVAWFAAWLSGDPAALVKKWPGDPPRLLYLPSACASNNRPPGPLRELFRNGCAIAYVVGD